MEKKLYEIIHYRYGDICNDDYYGKKSELVTDDIVFDTEENVAKAVDALNKRNGSYYAYEQENEFDSWYMDEDYYYYKAVEPEPLEDLLKRYHVI